MTLIAMVLGLTAVLLFGGYIKDLTYGMQTDFVTRTGHLQIQHKDYYQLGSGSAAIDAGADVGVTHDLVQTVRPQGAKVDIGAYEAMATSGYKTYLPLTQK